MVYIYFNKINFCSSLLADYKKITNAASSNVEKYIGNPINVYRLIRKLTVDFSLIKYSILNELEVKSVKIDL